MQFIGPSILQIPLSAYCDILNISDSIGRRLILKTAFDYYALFKLVLNTY